MSLHTIQVLSWPLDSIAVISFISCRGISSLDQKCFNLIVSEGGAPTQCELITDYLKLKVKHQPGPDKVKVYSFVEDLAASGGYWLACAGERIYVKETSVVGSIGVISMGFGFNKAMENLKDCGYFFGYELLYEGTLEQR